MKLVLSLIPILALTSCVAAYKQNPLSVPNAKLSGGKPVLIATPANGFFGAEEYRSSGRMTAMAIRAAFERHTNDTAVVAECQDIECLKKQDARDAGYYVIPEILHWEERATEWSGKPDRIEVKISIYDAGNLQELASVIISGKSKWATFGGDHSQDLLPEPIGNYVDSLYQGQF